MSHCYTRTPASRPICRKISFAINCIFCIHLKSNQHVDLFVVESARCVVHFIIILSTVSTRPILALPPGSTAAALVPAFRRRLARELDRVRSVISQTDARKAQLQEDRSVELERLSALLTQRVQMGHAALDAHLSALRGWAARAESLATSLSASIRAPPAPDAAAALLAQVNAAVRAAPAAPTPTLPDAFLQLSPPSLDDTKPADRPPAALPPALPAPPLPLPLPPAREALPLSSGPAAGVTASAADLARDLLEERGRRQRTEAELTRTQGELAELRHVYGHLEAATAALRFQQRAVAAADPHG